MNGLQPGQTFPGGWFVVSVTPRLVLEQRLESDLLRRAVVPTGPLLLAVFLFGASWDSQWGIRLAVWPVALAFVGTSVLGVLNLLRSIRRRRDGVRLTVDATTVSGYPEARGWLSDYFVTVAAHPRAAAKAATLTVYRDPKRGTASRAKLRIELHGGGALVGPEASGTDAEWAEVRDALLPAGEAIAAALGTPLVVGASPPVPPAPDASAREGGDLEA